MVIPRCHLPAACRILQYVRTADSARRCTSVAAAESITSCIRDRAAVSVGAGARSLRVLSVAMSSTLTAGSNYRCAQSETEITDVDVDDDGRHDDDSDTTGLRQFTRDELLAFDGQTPGQPIYIAVLGNVYDVSTGRKFYGPGMSPYSASAISCTAKNLYTVGQKNGTTLFLQ